MRNRLADRLTTWRAWYAVLGMIAFVLGGMLTLAGALGAVLMPLQFLAIAAIALALIGLVSRRFPTVEDLALKPTLSRYDVGVIAAVFVVSHVLYFLVGLTAEGPGTVETAEEYFEEMALGSGFVPDLAILFTSVVLAGICEEILYRGAILRPVHDALARRGRPGVGAVVGILVASFAFALPHLGGSLLDPLTVQYLLTGVAFGLVYVWTGSLTAAVVAHALQSMVAFGQILVLGHGDVAVAPWMYVVVFGCPLWVYLGAGGLWAVLPKADTEAATPG